MTRIFLILLSTATAFYLAACVNPDEQRSKTKHRYGYGTDGSTTTNVIADESSEPKPKPESTESSSHPSQTTPQPPPPTTDMQSPGSSANAPKQEYPYGKSVAGKPGFVTSPYSPYSGYVDVRGFPPGTEVKDPYSGKIF